MRYFINKRQIAAAAVFSAFLMGGAQAETEEPEPMALRAIMEGLGQDMQQIVDGVSREDWARVEQAAMRIADHPRPPLSERLRILAFVGTDMGQFKSLDEDIHATARKLAAEGQRGDGPAVIATFAELQSKCLACHQLFRQRFRQHFYGHGARD